MRIPGEGLERETNRLLFAGMGVVALPRRREDAFSERRVQAKGLRIEIYGFLLA